MVDHGIPRRPPDDPPTGSGAMPTFDELASALDIFAPNFWSDLGQDPNSSSISSVQHVHNDNPNSSLGYHPDPNDSLAWTLDVPHGILTAPTLATWPPQFDDQPPWLDKQYPEIVTNGADGIDWPFNAAGNPSLCGAGGTSFPHLEAAPDSLFTVLPNPITPDSISPAGPFPFPSDWGGPYSVVERVDPLRPQQVLDHYDATWAHLALLASPPRSPDPPNLLGSVALATSPEAGILDFGFDQAVCIPGMLPPSPDSPPALSPASSDSSGAESSSGDELSFQYPLFPGPSPAIVAPVPASPDPPSAPSSPTLNEKELKWKAEIDTYVDSLAMMRQHRGSGPSLVKLKCKWCKKTDRRPSELKEHMYAHRCLALFPCPRLGCAHVSNRRSNLVRHLNKCHVGCAADVGSPSESLVS